MRGFTWVRIRLLVVFLIISHKNFSQNHIPDTSAEASQLQNAVSLYHQFLSPETELYDGTEYTYNTYYPFVINEGHPFFQSRQFEPGSVFYNGALFEKVPLLYDIIKGELLIQNPAILILSGCTMKRYGGSLF